MTFTLIGKCNKEDAYGIAVVTKAFAVGERVPHAEYGIGVVATQARTDSTYGYLGLRLMELNLSPDGILNLLLKNDPNSEFRQVAMMDWSGRVAVHTGKKVLPESHHIISSNCIAIGNTLTSKKVLHKMMDSFISNTKLPLADRLLEGIKSGDQVGGDKRGATSAALIVVSSKELSERLGKFINLRVDDNKNPLEELNRLLQGYRAWKQKAILKGLVG